MTEKRFNTDCVQLVLQGLLGRKVSIEEVIFFIESKEYGIIDYDEMWQRNRSIHPLATSFWDKAAWTQNKKEITRDIDKARQKYRSFKY